MKESVLSVRVIKLPKTKTELTLYLRWRRSEVKGEVNRELEEHGDRTNVHRAMSMLGHKMTSSL